MIEYDRIRGDDGSIAVRQRQSAERLQLNSVIDQAIQRIDELSEEKIVLEQEQLAIEVEVGPIKYIAEMIYGNSDRETIDKAVQIVIILLILVFDPLAILLVVAANMSLRQRKGESIAFISEKDLEVSEDFNLEPKIEEEVDDEVSEISEIVEILEPKVEEVEEVEPEIEPEPETEVEDTDLELSEDDLQQVQRVDRRVRRKLEWLIDKRDVKKK